MSPAMKTRSTRIEAAGCTVVARVEVEENQLAGQAVLSAASAAAQHLVAAACGNAAAAPVRVKITRSG